MIPMRQYELTISYDNTEDDWDDLVNTINGGKPPSEFYFVNGRKILKYIFSDASEVDASMLMCGLMVGSHGDIKIDGIEIIHSMSNTIEDWDIVKKMSRNILCLGCNYSYRYVNKFRCPNCGLGALGSQIAQE